MKTQLCLVTLHGVVACGLRTTLPYQHSKKNNAVLNHVNLDLGVALYD